ncbi:mucoidy inhibitor MuiA family protein [Pseudophaeobacter sp.]|uniref:DUF4139 domain-containing protein n=1 Tax=Pseudophaeobacter sp. TaxID=1971739 RepID=UPI00329993DA
MRLSLSLLSILASSAASFVWADDIAVTSRVAEVTVFPQAAEITRRADLDLPAGHHRLILSNIPRTADLSTLQIDLTGADQTALLFREDGVPPRDGNDPEVIAAEMTIKEIETRIQAVQDEAAQSRSEAAAARTAIGFLEQLGSNEGLADAGPDTLRDIARMISAEADTAGKQALAAQTRARNIEDRLEALEKELAAARQTLEAIAREDQDRLYLAIEVDVPEAGAGALVLRYFSEGEVYSEPNYEWHLTTGADAKVSLQRAFGVTQQTGENWEAVDLTISTQQPGEQGAPSHLSPVLRRIADPRPQAKQRTLALGDYAEAAVPAPMAEPVIMEDAAGASWGADTSGPGVTYHFEHPVTIASGADILRLDMDSLETGVEVTAVAVPARDETAYRVAKFTNTFAEDLLAADWVPHFVDGKLVTFSSFAGLAAGQEAELGFGAIRGLRLTRDVLQKSEGERGMISRSNQQEETVEISVENLTGKNWPVRLIDRVPYTEQEELEITWSARPAPNEENVDRQRGILAWEFDLAPGEDRVIRLDTKMSWPEGKLLR